MLYNFDESVLYTCLVILALVLIFATVKKRSFSYGLFVLIFGVYLIGVISVVIFPIFVPDPTMLAQAAPWHNINLIPFNFGVNCAEYDPCLWQIRDNILLTVPFGFGIRFIALVKARDFVWLPFAVGLVFEISQSIVSQGMFRSFDVNDILLNAAGVMIGYACFRVFGQIYRGMIDLLKITPRWLFADIYNVVK